MPFVKGPLPQRLKLAHGFGAVAFGVKDSGLGREGIKFAMEDMTEIRLLVIRTPPSER